MRMIKKLLAAIVVLSILMSLAVVSAGASSYTDVKDGMYYTEAVEALTTYGIVSGYAGKFRPTANITRAEFSKITALISGLEDEAYSNAASRKFDDVAINHWANGFINTVANNKLIVGYPNGKFQPEKSITFAEAVTVALRALGYSTTELGDNWPYAYMVKADGLNLTDGLNLADNTPISRADLCVIINRALETQMNNSTAKLISKMDITITDEVLVIATRNEDSSLASDEIKTDAGTYTLANTSLEIEPMSRVKLVFNKDKEVINFTDFSTSERAFTTVDSVVDGEAYFSNGTSTVNLGVSNNTSVYYDGTLTTYGNFKNSIKEGAAVSIVYDNNKKVRYLVFGNADYTEPVAIRSDIYTALASVGVSKAKVDSATVIKDGYAATLGDAKLYDVVYYLEDNNTIYLYSDKVSGIYNKAFPNKANVSSVEISGTTIELETHTAAYKLGEKSGSYKIGSRITALLGMDGKVVDVVDLNSSDTANYGILISYTTEMSNDASESGKQYNYITVINGEGNTMKYKTKTNYSERIGDVGKLSFDNDGYAMFVTITTGSNISGEIDKNNRKIGNRWLTSDCVIIERTYAPDTRTGTATAHVIELKDITASELTARQVIYGVTSGDFGDISLLIVENVTNDQYTYGVLVNMGGRVNSTSTSGTYEVFSNGSTKTYSANFYNNITPGTAVALELDGSKLVGIKKLVAVETGVSVSAIDFSRVKIGDDVYRLSDNLQIIKRTSSGYMGMSRNELTELVGKTVNLYADTLTTLGGVIRVITVNN